MFIFKKYVSLGNNCKTRHQIDRVFSTRVTGYQPAKGYFDWLWGGGIDGVTKIFKNKFEISVNNLIVKKIGGTSQVYDESTGFYFLHDFVFSEIGLTDLEHANREMLSQFNEFSQKYSAMADKTKAYFKNIDDVCFVYYGCITRTQIEDFFTITAEIFGFKPMLLNIVDFNDQTHKDEIWGYEDILKIRIVNDESVKGTPSEWMGFNESWDNAFQDFALI